MSNDAKSGTDPAQGTMPPELRPFAKPEPAQPLVVPGKEAEFNAAVEALRLINGGQQADPFYVDPKHAGAGERKAPASVAVYVPAGVVPAIGAKASKGAAGTKVVIREGKPLSGRAKAAAIVLVLAVVVVAVGLGVRAVVSGRGRAGAGEGEGSVPMVTATVSAAVPAAPVMSAVATASAVPAENAAPSQSAAVPAALPAPEVVPKQGNHAAVRPSSAASDDPYRGAAASAPRASAMPSVAPLPSPAPVVTTAPSAPAAKPTAAPGPASGEFFNLPPPKQGDGTGR